MPLLGALSRLETRTGKGFMKIDYVELSSTDFMATKAFYGTVFGCGRLKNGAQTIWRFRGQG